MANPFYETQTPYKQGMAVLKSDLVPNAIFELGEPVQTLGGLNGFLMEVSKDGIEGVMDISPTQVYSAITLIGPNQNVGDKVYYNPATGALTTSTFSIVFGKLVRESHTEVFPKVSGTYAVNLQLVNKS